ncbi:MAG: pyridoxamine 5'-phosphate oxidase family protein [Chloroflexi bacterium]|nr:pyridoxamine 5'-phosphate oxidase family protein [Chloroflexota bacterium]
MAATDHQRERATSRLRAALVYWLATTRPDGRPHAMPVWGVLLGEVFWFGTMGQKVVNLRHQPYAVVHHESGEDVAIIEGRVERHPWNEAPIEVSAAFRAKYVNPETGEPFELVDGEVPAGAGLYALRIEVGHAWVEGAFLETQTRWLADRSASQASAESGSAED